LAQEKRLIGMYHKILQFGKKKKWKSDQSGPIFPCLILCVGQKHIFQVKIWQNSPEKNHG
jgi:hypothetical protein